MPEPSKAQHIVYLPKTLTWGDLEEALDLLNRPDSDTLLHLDLDGDRIAVAWETPMAALPEEYEPPPWADAAKRLRLGRPDADEIRGED